MENQGLGLYAQIWGMGEYRKEEDNMLLFSPSLNLGWNNYMTFISVKSEGYTKKCTKIRDALNSAI